jgi:fluoride exporter
LWGVFEARQAALGPWRVVVLVGFLGSFTTFSSFAHDTGALLRGGDLLPALLNIAGQNAVGLLALLAGLALARWTS